MKTLSLLIVAIVLVGCNNPTSVPERVIESVTQKIISGAFPCELSGQPVINIEPGKYQLCLAEIKTEQGHWINATTWNDFEAGEIRFQISRECAEYKIFLW